MIEPIYSAKMNKSSPAQHIKKKLLLGKGELEFATDKLIDFESNKIVCGRDIINPIITSYLNSLGVIDVQQGSVLNEALTIGLSLETIPDFRKYFRLDKLKSISDEWQRMLYLYRNSISSQVQANILKKIFFLSQILGKELMKGDGVFLDTLNTEYKRNKDWYLDDSDNEEYAISIFHTKVPKNSKIIEIVTKINSLIEKFIQK
ncbi:MAG: hypothetical protein H7196_01435 [candidate division SR1 bacterium]|nr:hypothetical protein [candidate division SR1 bacterium]